MERFAREENLSLRDDRIPGARPAGFSLCNDAGVNIKAITATSELVLVSLYRTNERAKWEGLWARLESALSPWLASDNEDESP
jgi:hypothetical protein